MNMCRDKCIHAEPVSQAIDAMPDENELRQMSDIFKALSDPSRLKIVLSLLNGELCVCDLAVVCGQSESAVSHQLRLLRHLHVVKNRRQGKVVYYSLDDSHVVSLITQSLDHVKH